MQTATIDLSKIYTAEEFMALPLDPGYRYELVRGEIRIMSHPGGEHMLFGAKLSSALDHFARPNKLGWVLPPGRFQLRIPGEIKDSLRAPDLTFIVASKIGLLDKGAVTFPPDLAIEIYSFNDRPVNYVEKFQDYHEAGWNLVWLIYPPKSSPQYKAGTAEIYHLQESLEPVRTMQANEELVGEGVLEGFRLPLTDLFNYGV